MYNHLLPFATTDREREVLTALVKHKSGRKAAKALGVHHGTVFRVISRVKLKAQLKGISPEHDMVHGVPDAFNVKGVSTYYDRDGKPRGQWVKTDRDEVMRKLVMDAVLDGFKDEIPRELPVGLPQAHRNKDLLNCYVITDYHLGMLAWAPEAGEDWDLKIAEDFLLKWFEQAITQAPPAESAIFAQLSDFLHFDGFDAVTPTSKHLLDVDTRFPKLARVAIRVVRKIIRMMLQKYAIVYVIMADANHDPVSQIWMREWLSVLYEDEPRVVVDTSPSPYNAHEFGKNALFFHHGHKCRPSEVADVFVAMFREMYGRTTHAYAHMGHLHTNEVLENNLMILEQHRTLAPKDAFAARGGWLSGREAKVITYHAKGGEVGRIVLNSDMVK